ncbi:hypothetical protein JX265_003248 [Neoarthrinium moseri]|uniref:Uncharacterized protein n=1 Tax=Neoarthrinium moseri TaxID=1658444 RepID=A0A9Q0AT45_9PEZI|nr:hypothetical protein JX265_003248 [Neoarthrinium moseri]
MAYREKLPALNAANIRIQKGGNEDNKFNTVNFTVQLPFNYREIFDQEYWRDLKRFDNGEKGNGTYLHLQGQLEERLDDNYWKNETSENMETRRNSWQGNNNQVVVGFTLAYGNRRNPLTKEMVAQNNFSALRDPNQKIMVYNCGGPGTGTHPINQGWFQNFVENGYYVLFPNYRGCPCNLDIESWEPKPTIFNEDVWNSWKSSRREQASGQIFNLSIRNIARDIETVRRHLLGEKKWTVQCQSFGGSISMCLQSFYAEGIEEVQYCAAMIPINRSAYEVNMELFKVVIARNEQFFNKYTNDKKKTKEIVDYFAKYDLKAPSEGKLTPKRFLCLGRALGNTTKFEALHNVIESMHSAIQTGSSQSSPEWKEALKQYEKLDEKGWKNGKRPLYPLLTELQYPTLSPQKPDWGAERAAANYKEFWWVSKTNREIIEELQKDKNKPLAFSGEMVYKSFYEDYPSLQPFKQLAADLEEKLVLPEPTYDVKALKRNQIPTKVYIPTKDMHVSFKYSKENLTSFRTIIQRLEDDEAEHGAIRHTPKKALDYFMFGLRE